MTGTLSKEELREYLREALAETLRETARKDDHDAMVALSAEDLQILVKATVHETLANLGADADNPIEMQKDFQHLREWRCTMNDVRSKGILTLVGIIVAGVCTALWLGLKSSLHP